MWHMLKAVDAAQLPAWYCKLCICKVQTISPPHESCLSCWSMESGQSLFCSHKQSFQVLGTLMLQAAHLPGLRNGWRAQPHISTDK